MSGPPGYPLMPGYPSAGPPGYPMPPQYAMPPGFQRPPFPGPPPQGLRPLPQAPAGLPPAANTSVYVGKISPLLDDDTMRLVLQTCGPLRSWKRSTDPSTGVVKRFGFAEFESVDGVLRCTRVLRDFSLAGSALQVNLSQATQKFLDWHVEQLKMRRTAVISAQPVGPGALPGPPPLPAGDDTVGDEAAEKETRAKVEAIVFERVGDEDTIKSRYALVAEPEPQRPLPPPPPPPPMGQAAPAFVSGGVLPPTAAGGGHPPPDGRRDNDDPAERQRQADRERDRREWERREEARREERQLQDLERALDRSDAERERERQKEAERLREARRERQRELERDLQGGGHTDEDAIRRAALKRRRDARARDERRRKRQREREEDDAERRREEAEAVAAARRAAQEAERLQGAAKAAPAPAETEDRHAAVPMEAAEPSAADSTQLEDGGVASAEGVFVPGTSLGTLGFLKRPPAKRATVTAPLFSEAEEVPARRTLVPLEYTEEELRASLVNEYAQPEEPEQPPAAGAGSTDDARQKERAERRRRATEERDAKRALLAMIDAIPTTKDSLFAYTVDWEAFDKHGVSTTVAAWASKKVAELLGEAEPSLVEFITSHTVRHVEPQALLDELQVVLDEEAEAFVVKLWRLIIFEILKARSATAA